MKNALPLDLLEATQLTRAGRLSKPRRRFSAFFGSRGCASPSTIRRRGASSTRSSRGSTRRAPRRGSTTGSRVSSSARPFATRRARAPTSSISPRGYAGQPLPMIVMLHGCTQTPDDFAAGTRMNALAEERGCFVLYPAQTRAANRSRCWNWFKRADQRRDKGEPAILAGMTRECMRRYAIDPGQGVRGRPLRRRRHGGSPGRCLPRPLRCIWSPLRPCCGQRARCAVGIRCHARRAGGSKRRAQTTPGIGASYRVSRRPRYHGASE